MPEIVTVQAQDRPCTLYRYHHPKPSRTQLHHLQPVFLQNRVYGKIANNDTVPLCGLCHDSVHDWLSYLLGGARKPRPTPAARARKMAQAAFDWYQLEKR